MNEFLHADTLSMMIQAVACLIASIALLIAARGYAGTSRSTWTTNNYYGVGEIEEEPCTP